MNIRSSRWIGSEVREHPVYDGTSNLHSFLVELEHKFFLEKIILVLDVALRSYSSRWWATHMGTLYSWDKEKCAIQHRFIPPSQVTHLNHEHEPNCQTSTLVAYDGFFDPREHVAHCIQVWEVVQLPSQFWVHQFIHSMGKIPTSWYVHEDARRQNTC
jgi:hypothetical protein